MTQAIAEKDVRRHPRQRSDDKVRLVWQNTSGQTQWLSGACLDISQSGMRVELTARIPARQVVNFELLRNEFRGTAVVRCCQPAGLRFHIGLEFTGGQKWKA